MAELEADTVVILSSELISKIVGEYFNRKMFKESVEIVDLKPTETGYMFSVAFIASKKVTSSRNEVNIEAINENLRHMNITIPARANNGKFTKVEKVNGNT